MAVIVEVVSSSCNSIRSRSISGGGGSSISSRVVIVVKQIKDYFIKI